ncbi:nuclear transport factor 2 family protein [Novosphingobium guangzhouense]|uniref:Polyketide cyclase n=1 Tax=Novosphingobium guangzhouense TaxID=1850347 RepID=A0A2K2G053_9SPHN|nr:nuclear transport factor 2 family protein [Novosphingobium guangzhouense]PNU04374.1 polyketide cyclase [Novosphingobium guangzhouense]
MNEMALLARRVALLEAEVAVRRVAMRYFRLCDTLGPETPFDELGDLFAADAVWEGRGRYRKAFGRHEGRDAIVAMLASYSNPPHFALNAHYLSSEVIEVTGDDSATAGWMMLQVSTYRDGRSDLRSAALTLDFQRQDGVWRIARFVTENIFSRDVGPWNDEAPISVPDASE